MKVETGLKTLMMHATAIAAVIALSGCGSSFQATQSLVGGGNVGGSGSGGGGSGEIPASLKIDGAVEGSMFDQTQTVSFDRVKKELLLTLPMPLNIYIDDLTLDLPLDPQRLPGAKLSVVRQARGGSALVLRLPLQYVLRGVNFLPGSKLPNGDPLPQVPDGELPALGLQLTKAIKDIKATIYLGINVVGIYVNTPFDPFIGMTFPIRSGDRARTWGYFSTIPAKNNVDGGFFVSFAMPDDLARILDEYL